MKLPSEAKKTKYGITNKSYILKNNEIFRVSEPKINEMINNRKNEIKILNLIKNYKKNITTKILKYGYDENNYFYLKTKFIPFSFNLEEKGIDKKSINKVFQLINDFHNIPTNGTKIEKFNYYNFIKNFKSKIKNPLINLDEYENEINKIFKKYKPKKLVLSHNDMVRGNFLFENNKEDNFYIIDFEYSSLNDPLYDVASFISESIVMIKDKNKRNELQQYWISLFNLSNKEIKMVKKWIFYQNVSGAFWANAMFDLTNNNIFKKILEDKYHQIKNFY